MPEYIEREPLLAEYDREHTGSPGRARELIVNAPSVNVVPVRYGRWIWDNDAVDWGLGAWVRSECHGRNENIHAGKPGRDDTIGKYPYAWAGSQFCPNCGAKMEVGE